MNYIILVQKACSLVWNNQVMALLARTVKCLVSIPETGYMMTNMCGLSGNNTMKWAFLCILLHLGTLLATPHFWRNVATCVHTVKYNRGRYASMCNSPMLHCVAECSQDCAIYSMPSFSSFQNPLDSM